MNTAAACEIFLALFWVPPRARRSNKQTVPLGRPDSLARKPITGGKDARPRPSHKADHKVWRALVPAHFGWSVPGAFFALDAIELVGLPADRRIGSCALLFAVELFFESGQPPGQVAYLLA